MNYYFGKPGEPVRTTLAGLIATEIALNLQHGEVCVATDDVIEAPIRISADGKSIESREVAFEEERDQTIFNAKRYAFDRESSGMAASCGQIATDSASQSRIAAQVNAALVAKATGGEYSISWRLMDDSYVGLGADDMMKLATELASFINAVHVRKHEILRSLTDAQTIDDLRAVILDDGYPA